MYGLRTLFPHCVIFILLTQTWVHFTRIQSLGSWEWFFLLCFRLNVFIIWKFSSSICWNDSCSSTMINIIGSVFAVGRALHSLVKGNCKLEFPLYLFPLDLPPVPGNIVRGSAPHPSTIYNPFTTATSRTFFIDMSALYTCGKRRRTCKLL